MNERWVDADSFEAGAGEVARKLREVEMERDEYRALLNLAVARLQDFEDEEVLPVIEASLRELNERED